MTSLPLPNPPAAADRAVFTPPNRLGAVNVAAGALLALVVAGALAVLSVLEGVTFASFMMTLAAGVLVTGGSIAAYWAWASLTLRYELADGLLVIRWGLIRYETPVSRFQRVVRGRANREPVVRGLNLPGLHIGHTRVPRVGVVRVLSLHRSPDEILYLLGAAESFAISVGDRRAFVRAVQAHAEIEPATTEARVLAHPALRLFSWHDRPVQMVLGVAAALTLVATGVVFSRYSGFPDVIQMNFPEGGSVGERTTLLAIPAFAWLALLLNAAIGVTFAATRRAAAFTVLYGLAFVEGLFVVAAVTAV